VPETSTQNRTAAKATTERELQTLADLQKTACSTGDEG